MTTTGRARAGLGTSKAGPADPATQGVPVAILAIRGEALEALRDHLDAFRSEQGLPVSSKQATSAGSAPVDVVPVGPVVLDPRDELWRVLGTMGERRRSILRRSALVPDGASMDVVASDQGITGERLRRIREAGLGRIRSAAASILATEGGGFADRLFEGRDLVEDDAIPAALEGIDPILPLCVAAVHGNLETWLGTFARRVGIGWIRGAVTEGMDRDVGTPSEGLQVAASSEADDGGALDARVPAAGGSRIASSSGGPRPSGREPSTAWKRRPSDAVPEERTPSMPDMADLAEALRMSSMTVARLRKARPLPTVADLLRDEAGVAASLMRVYGIGAKKVDVILERFRTSPSDLSIGMHASNRREASTTEPADVAVPDPGEDTASAQVPVEVVPDLRDPLDVLQDLLAAMPRRQAVLLARHLPGFRSGRSLDDSSVEFGITKERIRQIVARATASIRETAAAFLAQEQERLERLALGPDGSARARSIPDVLEEGDPAACLCIAAVHASSTKWLDGFSELIEGERYHVDLLAAVRSEAETVGRGIEGLPLPRPVSSVGALRGRSSAWLRAFSASSERHRVRDGYLVSRIETRLERETAILHSAACVEGPTFDAPSLVERVEAPQRFGRGVLERYRPLAAHLFDRLYDDTWFLIEERIGDPSAHPVFPKSVEDQGRPDPGGLRARLVELLRRHGALSAGEMAELWPEELTEAQRWALKSAQARCGGFRRVAPGIVGLEDWDPSEPLPRSAFDLGAASDLAFAYRSGEGRGWYPGWTARYEMLLCELADAEGMPAVSESLLSVCDPSAWPCAEEEKTVWERRKAEAEFRLLPRMPAFDGRLPEPGRILACLVHMRNRNTIGWMAVNRVEGSRLDVSTGAGTLAFLVGCGAAGAAAAWHDPHPKGPRFVEWYEALMEERRVGGGWSWIHGVPAAMLEAVRSFDTTGTWIPRSVGSVATSVATSSSRGRAFGTRMPKGRSGRAG